LNPIPFIHIRAGSDQDFENRTTVYLGRLVQRRLTQPILGLDIDTAIYEDPDYLFLGRPNGHMQTRVSLEVTLIDVRSAIEQYEEDIEPVIENGEMEDCSAVEASLYICASIEEGDECWDVSNGACDMEGRTFPALAVDVRTVGNEVADSFKITTLNCSVESGAINLSLEFSPLFERFWPDLDLI
jgi:hypothetical protein